MGAPIKGPLEIRLKPGMYYVQVILSEIDCAFFTQIYMNQTIAEYHVKLWLIKKKFTTISYLLTCSGQQNAILTAN